MDVSAALLACAASVALAAMAPGTARAGVDSPWAHVAEPSPGPSHAVGGYSAGCLAGAQRVPARGRGFRVMQPARHRVYAHRDLIAVIRDLGAAVAARHLGFLPLGDLSQPRGGPAPSGHASHQTGLDVDVWYAAGRRHQAVSMLAADGSGPAAAWTEVRRTVVALVASDPRVERVFVHPLLKRSLCELTLGDRAWLHKVRPWWGHDDHFHVRLACPADDPACVPQEPIADGDGCAELDWWLSPDRQAERATSRDGYRARVGALPALPPDCDAVLAPAPDRLSTSGIRPPAPAPAPP